MMSELNYDVIKMRYEAFLQEAEQERLIRSLRGDQPSMIHIWLHRIGTLLVTLGQWIKNRQLIQPATERVA